MLHVWVLTVWMFCSVSRDLLPGAVGVLRSECCHNPRLLAFLSAALAEQQRWPCTGAGAGAADGPAPAFGVKKKLLWFLVVH